MIPQNAEQAERLIRDARTQAAQDRRWAAIHRQQASNHDALADASEADAEAMRAMFPASPSPAQAQP